MTKRFLLGVVLALGLSASLAAQGSLSNQVLQLLVRVNAWTATNTFSDLRLAVGVPSDTAHRIYTDVAGNLYYQGQLIAGSSGGAVPHNLLSTTHPDTLPAAVARGALIVGNATPAWSRLTIGASGTVLLSNGTDAAWGTNGASLTSLNAAALTGTAAAINGAAITALNASALASGTVPLARVSGLTTSQLDAAAGITYAQLSIAGGLLNADVNASAAIAYSKLALTGSIVTGDLTAATLLFDRWASNSCTNLQVPQYNGSAWVCKTLATADVSGAGTVTSVALSAPAIFAVAGTPITTTGTLAVTLATQTANFVWAGPTTAGPTAPTFRALVNADLPISGVAASTYAKVTVNTRGVVTAAAAQIDLTADVSGILPRANGGTGVAVAADDTVLIGTGAAWAAQTLPDCASALIYTQSTNLFTCNTTTHTAALFQSTAAKILLAGTGVGASQLAVSQTTKPTCTSNCGTSPSIVGSDSFMVVTMGASGSPTSGWVVTFNGTWAAAPACTAQMALAGMVVGKLPLTVVTTTTTATVVTNGTAPATSDVYVLHCGGTQ